MEGNVYISVFPNFPEIATWKEHRLTRRNRFVMRKELISKVRFKSSFCQIKNTIEIVLIVPKGLFSKLSFDFLK
jgi:hypothetical protein